IDSRLAERNSRTSARKASVSSSKFRSNSGQLSQLWFDHLAAGIAGQRVDEPHRSRCLEVRQMLTGVADHRLLVESRAGSRDDERPADFAQSLVGNSDHRGVGYPL